VQDWARTSFPEHERFVHKSGRPNKTFVLKAEQMFTEPEPEQSIKATRRTKHPNKTTDPQTTSERPPNDPQTSKKRQTIFRRTFINVQGKIRI
jgi:hypothetical protein